MSEDAGLDTPTTSITSEELSERIADIQLLRKFKKLSFWGACAFTALYLVGFFVWACVLLRGFMRHHDFLNQPSHLWVTCLIILAVIPTTMALALLRFAFSEKNKGDSNDSKDMPSMWLQMAKEIADVIKDYISKKS
ncbi:hypothetical protein [Rosenbergiella australiborealis]|uniref:hypothetical protein n=1 Tax=Rosenbergiella australiborealis TaxID=1544696 RepID=UPI001F4EEA5C|nr:hypothetical protein [Rosenbergiella australiborealis]